jgi:DNA-3-methyladenine glycosylase
LKLLNPEFYLNNDPLFLAKELLGKVIFSNINGIQTSGIIVETEAYIAPNDLASHAKHNKRTPKNKTMFAIGGTAYVYKCYGIHDMINVVTGPLNTAHAILIRAIEPLDGLEIIQKRRKSDKNNYHLTGGPGKVAQALGITTYDDAMIYYHDESPLKIYDYEIKIKSIISGPRVGMSHFTKEWGHKPYRFFIKDNKWVSRPLDIKYNW